MSWHPGRQSTPCRARRRGSPWPACRDRQVPVGPRAVGPICAEPTLPALSAAATRPHTAGRSVAIPASRRPWAAIGYCSSHRLVPMPRPTVAVVRTKSSTTLRSLVSPRAHPLPVAGSVRRRSPVYSRRDPLPAAFHHKHVLLPPPSCTNIGPTLACWPRRAASSPE
jgi:hypothetical protein